MECEMTKMSASRMDKPTIKAIVIDTPCGNFVECVKKSTSGARVYDIKMASTSGTRTFSSQCNAAAERIPAITTRQTVLTCSSGFATLAMLKGAGGGLFTFK
mmetsp:Transcript_2156/g.5025  ORF Transcript_2156/g.5025 Transcript_2156/m.5025 type:complete len:102 (-) Transcript_2156:153-458(-)